MSLFSFLDHSPPVAAQEPISFSASNLAGTSLSNPTSLQFGPDGRLYVSQQNGLLQVYTVVRNGPNNYAITATENITSVLTMQNHNDDGSLNSTIQRQVTGLMVAGTAANPVLYVTSSDWRISVGFDSNLDTNSGVLSRLTWNGSSWTKVDLVRGLPRNEENHSTNGMVLDATNNLLYIAQGGHTNMGAPSNSFAYQPEYALSAAILVVDLGMIGNNTYDIPTLDDPSRPNVSPGVDQNDPFGGNNGLNQARIVPGGPVQVFSPGYRNPFDILIAESGLFYTIDNGPNSGWGGPPINNGPQGTCTNAPNENNSAGLPDGLHHINTIGYYGGHPAPVRGNPVGIFGNETNSPVPFSMANPVECDYRAPTLPPAQGGSLTNFNASTNGLTEYTASNFGGALQNDLLTASFDNTISRIILNEAGTAVVSKAFFFTNFAATPLDVVAQGDNDVFPGTIWSANYSSNDITIFEPADYDGGGFECTGEDDALLDEDNDGYNNADELDNGSDPCSGGSLPPDNDQDFISDLNDPDDDNDGIPDVQDAFAIDVTNGLTTTLPLRSDLFNNDPGTGFFGVGFTGLMTQPSGSPGVDYLTQFDPENMTVGGAAGRFTVESIPATSASGSTNNQAYAFQRGVNVTAATGPFVYRSRIASPYFNSQTPQGNQSLGMYIGNGDQDNYVKIAFAANGGNGGIEVVAETAGVATTAVYNAPGILASTYVDLFLAVNPVTGVIQPRYSFNDGTVTNAGPAITLPGSSALFQAINGAPSMAFGFIGTSSGGSPFSGIWELYELALDQPSTLTASDTTVNFGDAFVGSSPTETVTLTNAGITGAPNITINGLNVSGSGFSLVGAPSLPLNLTPGQSVELTVQFSPSAATAFNGQINVNHNGVNSPVAITLSGTGIIQLDPLYRVNAGGGAITTGEFPWSADSGGSPSPYVNTGASGNQVFSLASTIDLTDESIPANTPMSLFQTERWDPAGAAEMIWNFPISIPGTYTVNLYFAEIYTGAFSNGARVFDVAVEGQVALDNYDIYADVGGNTGVVKSFVTEVTDGNLTVEFIHVVENPAIKAIEILPVGSEPGAALVADQSSVNFGEIAVDSSSDVELIKLTHAGEAGQPAINITQAALSGANSAEFAISNFAPLTLDPGESTDIEVTFNPVSAGNKTAALNITHNGTNTSPLVVNLTGQGIAVSAGAELQVQPVSLDFGEVTVGFTSEPLPVQLTNTAGAGGDNLTISGVMLTGANPTQFQTSFLSPVVLAPGQSTTIGVTFQPTSEGTLLATLNISHNGVNASPQSVALVGVGLAGGQTGQWSIVQANNTPSARHENGFVEAGGRFYLIGGRGTKPVNIFDPATGNWTTGANPPIEIHHVQAIEYNDLIYVVGAYTGNCCDAEFGVSNIYIYNPTANTWTVGPEIPAARRRGSVGVVLYNNRFYMVGGLNGGHGSTATSYNLFDEFNPATNTWTVLPNAPRNRDHFNAVVVDGKLYAAGGRDTSDGSIFNDTIAEVDVFDFATGQWSTLPASANLPTPRGGSMAVALGNEVIVIGGESGTQTVAHNEVEALNVLTETWQTLDPLNVGRHGTQATVCNGSIYVAAGSGQRGGGPELSSLEVYVPGGAASCGETGTAPTLQASSSSVSFGSVVVGAVSSQQTVSLTNNGSSGTVTISSISVNGANAGDFAAVLATPVTLSAGQSANVNLTFTPTNSGARTATLSVVHNGANTSPITITLTGTGLAQQVANLNASTTVVSFGNVAVGGTSGSQTVTLTHQGGAGSGNITINNVALSGANAAEFSAALNTPVTLTPGQTASVTVSFSPVTAGGKTANLNVTHTGANASPLVINLSGTGTTSSGSEILYRVNAGGPSITASPMNWGADTAASPSTYGNAAAASSNTYSNPVTINLTDASIPAGTPAQLFQTERWDSSSGAPMTWNFPVTSSGTYTVRLYFAEIYSGAFTNGYRVFDVSIEDNVVLDNYDIYADVGGNTGVMQSFDVAVTDGAITIVFGHVTENPSLKGIEILTAGSAPVNTAPVVTSPGNQTGDEGGVVSLQVNATDADNDDLTFSATGLPPTLSINPASGLISGTLSAGSSGVYNITVTATDDGSPALNGAASFTWTVNAVGGSEPPVLTVTQATVTVPEGTTATNSGTVSDPDSASVNVTASVGTVTVNSSNWSWSYATTDGPGQSATVVITANDGEGGVTQSNFTLSVENVAPTANLTNASGTVDTGSPAMLTFSQQADPSSVDTSAGFEYAYDCAGDGTFEYNSVTPAQPCVYPAGGSYEAAGRITDKDGGSSTYTVTVTVNAQPATLGVSTTTVNFGSVNTGTTSGTQTVTLTHQGAAGSNTITINSIGLSGANASEFSAVLSTPVSLTPGQTASITVSFSPASGGAKSATLNIAHTGVNPSPLTVALNGTGTTVTPSDILYRVNTGGSAITASEMNWSADTAGSPSPYVNASAIGNQVFSNGNTITMTHASIPAGTPMQVFQSERWDPSGGAEMTWNFPVSANGTYTVRLYFAEIYSGAFSNGARVFDVLAEGVVVLDNYDIYAEVGGNTGVVKAFDVVVNDGSVTVQLGHVVENPSLKGIEILTAGSAPANTAPVVTSPGNQTDDVGETVNLAISASDGENDPLTYSAMGLPIGLSINPNSGVISGTLSSAGVYSVTVTATDDGSPALSGNASFTWTVNATGTSEPPVLTVTDESVTVAEGATANNSGTVNDPDSANVNVTASVGTVTVNGSNWSWSYAATDGPGQSATVVISASDGEGGVAQTSFALTVENVAPTATLSNTSGSVSAGTPALLAFSQQADASSVDVSAGFNYAYDCAGDGVFEYNSTNPSQACAYPAAGVYQVAGRISDKDGGSSSYTATVTVTAPVNTAPVVTSPGNQTNTVGAVINLGISASDAQNHTLTFSATGLPPGLSINPSSGVITGTLSTAGVYNVTVTALDNGTPALSGSTAFTWTVNAAPVVPAVTSFTLINADTNQPIAAFDPLINGAVVDLSILPTTNLNIRANISPATVGSVVFALDTLPIVLTDSTAPYMLLSETSSGSTAPGTYTMTATPYSGAGGSGTAGTPLTITFTVIAGD